MLEAIGYICFAGVILLIGSLVWLITEPLRTPLDPQGEE